MHSRVVSKPELETELEHTIGVVLNRVIKQFELEFQKRTSESATVIEGKDIDQMTSKIVMECGFTDVFKSLKKSGFETKE